MINLGSKKNENYYTTNYIKNDEINEIKNCCDGNDLLVIAKLYDLKTCLCSDRLNISSIKQKIDELSAFNKVQNYDYLSNLLCPEKARGSKVPSQIPIPSCSFQMKNSVTLTTNSSGCVALFMNPFFLANSSVIGTHSAVPELANGDRWFAQYASSVWVNNANSLTGNGPDSEWYAVNLGQTLPAVYDQYRVVSGSLTVRYIGRLDAVQGEIGGAIFCENVNTFGGKNAGSEELLPQNTAPTRARDLNKYGNFDYAEDAVYSKRNMTLEGMRLLYFPLDNSYEEFAKVATDQDIEIDRFSTEVWQEWNQVGKKQNGFNWFFWCRGGPFNSPCFRVDICLNFECLPSSSFLNYMPVTVSPCFLSLDEKKKAILVVQERCICSPKDENVYEVTVPSLFIKMMKKFKNGLPGFDRLRACGLIGAIPSLKPGLVLAGSMLQQSMQLDN